MAEQYHEEIRQVVRQAVQEAISEMVPPAVGAAVAHEAERAAASNQQRPPDIPYQAPPGGSNGGNTAATNDRFRARDIGFFDPRSRSNAVETKDNDQVYHNVYSFTNRVRVKSATMDAAVLRRNLDSCLRGRAETWYTEQLTDLQRIGLHPDPAGVTQWCKNGGTITTESAQVFTAWQHMDGRLRLDLPRPDDKTTMAEFQEWVKNTKHAWCDTYKERTDQKEKDRRKGGLNPQSQPGRQYYPGARPVYPYNGYQFPYRSGTPQAPINSKQEYHYEERGFTPNRGQFNRERTPLGRAPGTGIHQDRRTSKPRAQEKEVRLNRSSDERLLVRPSALLPTDQHHIDHAPTTPTTMADKPEPTQRKQITRKRRHTGRLKTSFMKTEESSRNQSTRKANIMKKNRRLLRKKVSWNKQRPLL
ncbi:MAG: T-complex protein 1 subunit beta [Watsoniomyces obsoletus]|nr:MAG: T-complex protein 1 subunit beta [Watsoniomyces obsoletus]